MGTVGLRISDEEPTRSCGDHHDADGAGSSHGYRSWMDDPATETPMPMGWGRAAQDVGPILGESPLASERPRPNPRTMRIMISGRL